MVAVAGNSVVCKITKPFTCTYVRNPKGKIVVTKNQTLTTGWQDSRIISILVTLSCSFSENSENSFSISIPIYSVETLKPTIRISIFWLPCVCGLCLISLFGQVTRAYVMWQLVTLQYRVTCSKAAASDYFSRLCFSALNLLAPEYHGLFVLLLLDSWQETLKWLGSAPTKKTLTKS